MRAVRLIGGTLGLLLAVAGCGSPTTPSSAVPVSGGSIVAPSTSASASSSAPSSPASASASASASIGPVGSGSLSPFACSTLTADEVATAVGVAGLTAVPQAGDASAGYCSYKAGDQAVGATAWLARGAGGAMSVPEQVGVGVPSLGDESIWVPTTNVLYIRKGDSLLTISLLATIVPADRIKDVTVALGHLAVARLPAH